jgi:hypothetical protein
MRETLVSKIVRFWPPLNQAFLVCGRKDCGFSPHGRQGLLTRRISDVQSRFVGGLTVAGA